MSFPDRSPIALLAALTITVIGAHLAAGILIPLAVAILLVIILSPGARLLSRMGLSSGLSHLLVIVVGVAALTGLGHLMVLSLADVRAKGPEYVDRYRELEGQVTAWLEARGLTVGGDLTPSALEPGALLDHLGVLARGLAGIGGQAILVALLVAFLVAEAYHLPTKLERAGANNLTGARKIIGHVQRYLVTKTFTSALTGLLIGGGAWMLGLDFPLFLGLLAFALNYIPTVGSIIAAVPGVVSALLVAGLPTVAATVALYLVVNMLIGNILEPLVLGRQMGLSPFAVLLSLMVWGTLWGPISAFLAIPLTMSVRIALEETETYSWLAVLLGSPKEATQSGEA